MISVLYARPKAETVSGDREQMLADIVKAEQRYEVTAFEVSLLRLITSKLSLSEQEINDLVKRYEQQ